MISINPADAVAGLIVIYAVATKFRSKTVWCLYMVACGIYAYLNVRCELYVQALMNVTVTLIALKNCLQKEKKDGSEPNN